MTNGVVRSIPKVLLLVLVLSGVVAMHQLPVAHNDHGSTAVVAGPESHPPSDAARSGHGCCPSHDHGQDTDSGSGLMLHMCLAVVAVGVALGALRRWRRTPDLRQRARVLCRLVGGAASRAPPWVHPTVYVLRVLRL